MLVKKVVIDRANRLFKMPPDILSFASLVPKRGLIRRPDLLDLATFAWPVEFDDDVVIKGERLRPASRSEIDGLKEEILAWMQTHAQARLTSTKEVYVGGGITHMLLALSLAYIDNGDLAFVPELGVPMYRKAIIAAGGEPVTYGISQKRGWSPDFSRVGSRVGHVARILFLNSPHNPTGGELTPKDLGELIWQAGKENLLIVNDAAYQSIAGRAPVSTLAVEGGRRVAVELYSLSYQFGLPHLPFGFAVGNREVIAGLEVASGLLPVTIPSWVVEMAHRAIRQYPNAAIKSVRQQCAQTSAEASRLLELLSLETVGGAAVPFIWCRIQRRAHAGTLARLLYRRYRILVAPGTSFGETGQGYIRMSLTRDAKTYGDAAARIKRRLDLLHGRKGEA
ncbi:MAG: aminotransferase class I/II-fold pyridoxal phosphate-dependent enzyme [Candidatus Zixiibacteriota bacterium]